MPARLTALAHVASYSSLVLCACVILRVRKAGYYERCGLWCTPASGFMQLRGDKPDFLQGILLLIPPPLIPPLTSLKGRKGLGTFAKSRLARTAGRAVRLCRPPRGRTSASLRGLTCHSCHRHGWPEKNLYTEGRGARAAGRCDA